MAVCIERLRAYTPQNIGIILINDCSTDTAIAPLLETVHDDPQFQVFHNEENLGFTRTVNKGLKLAGDADVIILNSDARVTPRWVEGMYAAAHSRSMVATVTAMSDRAGAFSAPNIGNENPLPSGVTEEEFARAFRRRSLRLYPEVPTGNGFCMYIRREALNALGPLDEKAFPRGYGEENDFCMRALRAGWTNLIDDSTYVFHDRSKSFGAAKDENIAHGRNVVDERYPEYKKLIGTYHTGVEINMARFRAWLALEDCTSGRATLPRALFVLATRTGGTPQTNADLMNALDNSFECLVLNCDALNLELSRVADGELETLRTHQLAERIEPLKHRSSEYDDVVAHWLHELDLDVVHIRHLGWHSLTLPKLAKQTGAQVVMSFHDFYSLCPSLKLLDDQGVFCGGTCTQGSGLCKVELWPHDSVPPLKNAWVHYWRERMEQALSYCDRYVTTSQSAADRLLNGFPSISAEHLHVIPHGRDFNRFTSLQHLPDGNGPIRILVPGNIDKAKGLELIAGVLALDHLRQFEFHVLGNVNKSALGGKIPSHMRLHGSYNRGDFARKVSSIAPAFGVVLSIWDETYCHTLTEMWSVGLPVAVLDFPTLRRRVSDSGAGWVLEDMEPAALLGCLTEIANNPQELVEKARAAGQWQTRRGAAQSTRQMAARYLDVYRGKKANDLTPKIGVLCPAGADLRTAYPSTEIRIWERTRNQLGRPVDYQRATAPALIAQMKMGMVEGAIVQRNAIPALQVEEFIATAQETGTPYILDLDDYLLDVPKDKDTDGYYSAYAKFLEKLIRNAAVVTVATLALQESMTAYNDNVVVLENRVSSRLWSDQPRADVNFEPNILYMGGPSHGEDLAFALEAITLARKQNPGIRLTVIGISNRNDLPEWVDVVEIPQEVRSYSAFVPWLRQNIGTAAIGIAPLLDTSFNRYKSDLKVLDYGALGLPVIASDVESYNPFNKDNINGAVQLASNRSEDWAKVILSELSRPEKLRDNGSALQEWVFRNRRTEDATYTFDDLVTNSLLKNEG